MSSLKAAIRPTLRDVKHHPLRSLAAILLIALPATYAAFLIGDMTSESQFYGITLQQNSAQFFGSECQQSVDASAYRCANGTRSGVADQDGKSNEDSTVERPATTISQDRIAEAVGNNFTVSMFVDLPVVLHSDAATDSLSSTITQLPGAHLLPGSPDLQPGDVVLSESAAKQLKVGIGDTVRATDVGKPNDPATSNREDDRITLNAADTTLTVKEIIPNNIHSSSYVIAPTFLPTTDVPNNARVTWVLSGKDDLSWNDVKALNKVGLVVSTQKFRNHPETVPVADRYPEFQSDRSSTENSDTNDSMITELTSYVIELTFYLLLTCLMLATISPVFAVATSRQTKVYALMRSQGANRRHIRWAVMTYGTVSGAIGATIGIVLGTILGWGYWKIAHPGWPFITDVGTLAIGFSIAVVGSTVAAFMPAIIVAKGEIIAGVAGMQPDRIRRWRRWMWTGPALVLMMLVVLLVEWLGHPITHFVNRDAFSGAMYDLIWSVLVLLLLVVIIGGVFTSVIALVFLAGAIRKPLGAKLAGRQVRRQALRSGAIVAAIIGSVFFLTVMELGSLNTINKDRQLSSEIYSPFAVGVSGARSASAFETPTMITTSYADVVAHAASDQAREVFDVVAARLGKTTEFPVVMPGSHMRLALADECQVSPTTKAYTYHGKDANTDPEAAKHCRYLRMDEAHLFLPFAMQDSDIVVGGPEVLQIFNLTDEQRASATQVLKDGGVVGTTAIVANTGRQKISVEKDTSNPVTAESQFQKTKTLELPFTAALPEQLHGWVVSPQAAEKLGIELAFDRYVVMTEQPGTMTDQVEMTDQIDAFSYYYHAQVLAVENSAYESIYVWVLFVGILLVVGLVLIVATPQLRAQNEQLYALGASTSLVRQIGGYYGAITAILGTWPAIILGHIVALLQTDFSEQDINGEVLSLGSVENFGPHWYLIVVLGLLVPAISAALGYITTRSNRMLSYRQD
jgi:hypothetical protein